MTTRYEYSTGTLTDPALQHNIIAIIDANGQIFLENDYGLESGLLSYNRVTRQRQGNGETIFDYGDVVEDFNLPYEVYQRPAHQTIVTERTGYSVRYLFNSYGNKVLEEKFARINGQPKLISTHYRYNKDGNLIGTISPEGVITQFLYSRDYFERKTSVGQDYRDIDDPHLDFKTRQSFNRLLVTVRRGRYYSIVSLNLSQGLWSDIFPDIYDTSTEDVIQKTTYEEDNGQLLTTSDPRHTYSADLDFNEPADYDRHLTRYTYSPNTSSQFHLLHTIESPSITSADGTVTGTAISKITSYDERGRILEKIDTQGLVTQMTYYNSQAGSMEGFLKETVLDPVQLSIKTAVDRDQLGRVIRNYSPKYFEGTDGRYVTKSEYNTLDQVLSVTTSLPFEFRSIRRYNRVGNVIEESFERKRSDNTPFEEPLLVNTYRYDEEFNVIKTTLGDRHYISHKKWRRVFDMAGRLLIEISPSGRKSKVYYNELSLVGKTVNDYGRTSATNKFYYDADGRRIRSINLMRIEAKFFYDSLNRLIESQDSLGNKRIFTYDKLGNVLIDRFFEKRNEKFYLLTRFECTYDELGRLTKKSLNVFDNPVEVIGGEIDVQTAFVQHGPGELQTTSYFYDKNGGVIKVVNPSGRSIIKTEYDKVGRRVKVIDAYDNEVIYLYDKNSNIVRSDKMEVIRALPNNEVIRHRYFASTYEYDELDRLIRQTDSLGNQHNYEYDSLNQMTKVIDPLTNTIEMEYDIFGRLTQTTRFLKEESGPHPLVIVNNGYVHDLDDNVIEQTDSLGRLTKFLYDSMGRRVSIVLPDSSHDAYTYNKSSQLVSYKDRNGLSQYYLYDAMGRLINLIIDDTNLSPGVSIEGSRTNLYSYDGLGRTIHMKNEVCEYTIFYNSLGLTTEEDFNYIASENPSNPMQFSIKRYYDMNNSLSDIVYPSGRKIRYSRDFLNRIISVEQLSKGLSYPGDNSIPENLIIMSVEYEGSQRRRINRHNRTSTQFHYDRGGRMIEINHTYSNLLLSHLQYLYDAIGNVRQRHEQNGDNHETKVLHYDSLYRISNVSRIEANSINNLEFLYPATNLLPEVIPDTQSQMNALVQENLPNTTGYVYDNVGNRLKKTESNQVIEEYIPNDSDQYEAINGSLLEYDAMGNLIEDEMWKYGYDYRNQLSSIRRKDNGATTKFYYDPLGRKILEIRDNHYKTLVYDGWNVIEEYSGNDLHSSIVLDESIDNVIQVAANNANFWIYPDILKSVTHVMKGEEEYQYYGYDEFGKTITPIEETVLENRFAGKRFLSDVEKYDFPFRTYDPKTGRFIQRDPLGYIDGSNLYTYALNNPQSTIDPFGTHREDIKQVYGGVEVPYDLWRSQMSGGEKPLRTYLEQRRITARRLFEGNKELQEDPDILITKPYYEEYNFANGAMERLEEETKRDLQEYMDTRYEEWVEDMRRIRTANVVGEFIVRGMVHTVSVFAGPAGPFVRELAMANDGPASLDRGIPSIGPSSMGGGGGGGRGPLGRGGGAPPPGGGRGGRLDKRGRAREVSGKPMRESKFVAMAEKFLGPNPREVPVGSGRHVSADGLRQVRYGVHETGKGLHHGHFEKYDIPASQGGRVIINVSVPIVRD